MKTTILTERDLDLIEVALDSCVQAVQAGATLNRRGVDPLAFEYLTALDHVEKMRREATNSDAERTTP